MLYLQNVENTLRVELDYEAVSKFILYDGHLSTVCTLYTYLIISISTKLNW